MAYQDARLICRPNSEWLTPDLISASDEDNDIEEVYVKTLTYNIIEDKKS